MLAGSLQGLGKAGHRSEEEMEEQSKDLLPCGPGPALVAGEKSTDSCPQSHPPQLLSGQPVSQQPQFHQHSCCKEGIHFSLGSFPSSLCPPPQAESPSPRQLSQDFQVSKTPGSTRPSFLLDQPPPPPKGSPVCSGWQLRLLCLTKGALTPRSWHPELSLVPAGHPG